MRFWLLFVVLSLAAGCGSKSGLLIPDYERDGGTDAPPMLDAGIDAPIVPDECVELPPDEPPSEVQVSFLSRILAADVLFLVDTTGSMTEEIAQISATLRDVLVPAMAETIGDVRFSVASVADFPEGMYGSAEDVPFLLLQESTSDIRQVQNAIDRLPTSAGVDGPESQTEGLYQAATGEGIGRYVPRATCPAGTVGYPCFRPEGSRIFLLFTDAAFHNGPMNTNAYGPEVRPPAHTYADSVNALRAIGAKVLGLFSGGGDAEALRDLTAIARDTGAVRESGEPIVFDIGSRGTDLDTGVIAAIETLVEEVPIDIDVLTEDADGDMFDANMFVRGIETVRAVPADGAIDLGDRYDRVLPGTRVTFRVLLQNELFPRGPEPIVMYLRVVLRGDGVTRLQSTLVQLLIPSIRNETCEDFGF